MAKTAGIRVSPAPSTTKSDASPACWLATDKLTPPDYDGDGRTDVAIWRPSDRVFWMVQSDSGAPSIVPLVAPGDIPIPSAFSE